MRACVDRYGSLVWAITSRTIRDRAEAEDAAQEAFIALWKAASRFDPTRSSERTFIAMIVRRRTIDRLRSKARRPTDGDSQRRNMGVCVGVQTRLQEIKFNKNINLGLL